MLFKDFLHLYWDADLKYPHVYSPKTGTMITVNGYACEAIEEDQGEYMLSHDQYDDEPLEMALTDIMPNFQVFTLSHNHIA